MSKDYKKIYAIKQANENKIKSLCSAAVDKCGIYLFSRIDELGFRYAYVGQAKKCLERLASHLSGYESHIDRSIKKHKFYSENNLSGYRVDILEYCDETELDRLEQVYILMYANNGYQMLNVTAGGQGKGKVNINESAPRKGYTQGKADGRSKLASELRYILDKHLELVVKKPGNKVQENALSKFCELIGKES